MIVTLLVCFASLNGSAFAMHLPTLILPSWLMHFVFGSSELLSDYHCCSGVQCWLCAKHSRFSFSQGHEDDELVLQPAYLPTKLILPLLHSQS